jgi:hypothetical protein
MTLIKQISNSHDICRHFFSYGCAEVLFDKIIGVMIISYLSISTFCTLRLDKHEFPKKTGHTGRVKIPPLSFQKKIEGRHWWELDRFRS